MAPLGAIWHAAHETGDVDVGEERERRPEQHRLPRRPLAWARVNPRCGETDGDVSDAGHSFFRLTSAFQPRRLIIPSAGAGGKRLLAGRPPQPAMRRCSPADLKQHTPMRSG
jgi:hypothetical protein